MLLLITLITFFVDLLIYAAGGIAAVAVWHVGWFLVVLLFLDKAVYE